MASIAGALEARIAREVLRCFCFRTASFAPWRLVNLAAGKTHRPDRARLPGGAALVCHLHLLGAPASYRLDGKWHRLGGAALAGDAVVVSIGMAVELVAAPHEGATMLETFLLNGDVATEAVQIGTSQCAAKGLAG